MKITYYNQADAIYIKLRDAEFGSNAKVAPGVILDLDAAGEVVGIEILAVSQRVPLQDLYDINISMPVGAR